MLQIQKAEKVKIRRDLSTNGAYQEIHEKVLDIGIRICILCWRIPQSYKEITVKIVFLTLYEKLRVIKQRADN